MNGELLGRMSARFARGIGRGALVLQAISLLTFIGVYSQAFSDYGIPLWFVFVVLTLIYVVVCLVSGYIEETKQIWPEETKHIWKMAGWDPDKLHSDIECIKLELQRLNEKVKQ